MDAERAALQGMTRREAAVEGPMREVVVAVRERAVKVRQRRVGAAMVREWRARTAAVRVWREGAILRVVSVATVVRERAVHGDARPGHRRRRGLRQRE